MEIGGRAFNSTGPGHTLSRKTIFSCHPDDKIDGETCATQILSRLARRAYRRPVTARETAALVRFYKMGFEDAGGNFEAGVQLALKAMLVSPNFLFRLERDDLAKPSPSGIRKLTDLEMASRLSFFLWSSIPDEQLLSVAEKGQLQQPDVMAAQVKRMLTDPKSKALVQNFAGQWLHLRNLALIKPDPEVFPEFDDSLRSSARRETECSSRRSSRKTGASSILSTASIRSSTSGWPNSGIRGSKGTSSGAWNSMDLNAAASSPRPAF